MAQEPNPFELQPPPQWGGMPQITPQTGEAPPPEQFGGLQPGPEGSYFQLSPEAMNMMWAPQPGQQIGLTPQQQPPPQINPLV